MEKKNKLFILYIFDFSIFSLTQNRFLPVIDGRIIIPYSVSSKIFESEIWGIIIIIDPQTWMSTCLLSICLSQLFLLPLSSYTFFSVRKLIIIPKLAPRNCHNHQNSSSNSSTRSRSSKKHSRNSSCRTAGILLR